MNFPNKIALLLLGLGAVLLQPALAEKGEALYGQHCAACHGYDGMGGVGVPLALPDFQYSVTDQYLKLTIRHGRPGRVMPAFKSLNEKQLNALVKYIRHWAPGRSFKYPKTPVKGDVKHGAKLYQQRCASCHGVNGEGGTGTGVTFSRPRELPIVAPALNNRSFLSSATDQFIKASLMNGREGTPMTSFLKQGLKEQDINDLVVFVRSFEKRSSTLRQTTTTKEPASISFESPYDFEATIQGVKAAIIGKNFRLIREQVLEDGLVEKGKENKKQYIIYFCNFSLLNKALAIDPRVGLFLPCRITIVEQQGKVMVHAINPKRLARLFNNSDLYKLCDEMSDIYLEIIEEATL